MVFETPRTELQAMDAAHYSAKEFLPDGRRVEIRAIRPEDEVDLIAAIHRTSAQSLYRRFFGVKHYFSDTEIALFLNVDFAKHVALVAVTEEESGDAIVGGGRYVTDESGRAEVAFAVIDQYQGKGIGTALMRHLVALGRDAGIKEFIAEVLPDNISMLNVFVNSGLKLNSKREAGVIHVTLQLL